MKSKSASQKRILLVDDHPLFRAVVCRMLSKHSDLTVVGEAGTPDELRKIIRPSKPDLILLDLALGDANGIDVMRELLATDRSLRFLILSMHQESVYATRALKAGARGYIMKKAPPEMLLTAIRRVLSGGIYLGPDLSIESGDYEPGSQLSPSPGDCLSEREMQVFRLIGKGRGTRQIAVELELSAKTIESYRAHIKDKLGLETSYDLLRAAIRWQRQESLL